MYINNFLVFSSLLLVRVEPLSSFHPKFALTDQLVHHLHRLEERVVWKTLMPTCTWETDNTCSEHMMEVGLACNLCRPSVG